MKSKLPKGWTKKHAKRVFDLIIESEIEEQILKMRRAGFQTTHGEARMVRGKIQITVW